jgi:hypothetical protein
MENGDVQRWTSADGQRTVTLSLEFACAWRVRSINYDDSSPSWKTEKRFPFRSLGKARAAFKAAIAAGEETTLNDPHPTKIQLDELVADHGNMAADHVAHGRYAEAESELMAAVRKVRSAAPDPLSAFDGECPECGSTAALDGDDGTVVCEGCGYIRVTP